MKLLSWSIHSPCLWNPSFITAFITTGYIIFPSRVYPLYTLLTCTFQIYFEFIIPFASFYSKWPLSFRLSDLSAACIFSSPMRVTRSTHLIFFDLIILIIFGKECKSYSSSFRSFQHLLLFLVSCFQILSLVPCARTRSVYTCLLK